MAAPVELEAKLGAWPGFRLPSLDGLAAWVHAAEPDEQRLSATYYDAADLRLIRAGATLRHRTGEPGSPEGRWTAKLARPGGAASVLERFEIDVDGPPDAIPEELVALVRGRLRTADLAPVARLETVRHRVGLLDGGGRRLGEIADDEVSVVEDDRVAARFREVEAEIERSAPSHLLDLVVERLRAAGAGAPDPTPKLVRALGPRALVPPDPVVPDLGPHASVADVVRAAIANAVQRLAAHDPIVRLDAGAVGVHQARVSMRRLRSDLRTFRDLVDPEWVATFAADLKWLADELGAVRDADVLAARLSVAIEQLSRADSIAAGALLRRLRRQRDRSLAELQASLTSERYLELLDRLVEAGRNPRLLDGADRPAAKVLPRLAARPWRKLKRAVGELDVDPPDEELHEVRILAKRARYAAEAASGVLPRAAAHAKAIAGLQEVLGDQHDAVVAEMWLREAVRAGASPAQALAAGVLIAAERAEAAAKRAAWRDAWDAANAKKVRAWLSS